MRMKKGKFDHEAFSIRFVFSVYPDTETLENASYPCRMFIIYSGPYFANSALLAATSKSSRLKRDFAA